MSNVIWVDENDNILGEVSREKAHQDGLLHRIAVVYLVNEKGEILINERAKDGHLDHSSAGHVEVGESYLEAAKRELEEELGVLGVELTDIGSTQADHHGETFHSMHLFRVFICSANPVKLQEDEVARVFWEKPTNILADMHANPEKYTEGFKRTIELFLSQRSA